MKSVFRFRRFSVRQDCCAMKVGTDAVLLGAWAPGGRRVLDIGSGTGVLALMMADRFPQAEVEGVEIDANAAGQASDNIAASPYAERVRVEAVALQDFQPQWPYDCIVTNPPFFLDSLVAPDAARTTARHAGAASLSFRDLFVFAKRWLTAEGPLSAVVPCSSFEAFATEAYLLGFRMTARMLVHTTADKPASRSLVTFRRCYRGDVALSEECLTEADGKQSAWYRGLTRDLLLDGDALKDDEND